MRALGLRTGPGRGTGEYFLERQTAKALAKLSQVPLPVFGALKKTSPFSASGAGSLVWQVKHGIGNAPETPSLYHLNTAISAMIATAPHWLKSDDTALSSCPDHSIVQPTPSESKPQRRDDLTFARRVMEGWPGEVSRFINEFRPAVLTYLLKLSWDARSREEAANAVDDVFSECFGGFAGKGRNGKKRVPLLQRYQGFGSLEGWLKRSARNRFYSALRRSEYRQRAAGVEPESDWVDAASIDPKSVVNSAEPGLNGHSSRYSVTSDERERIREAIAEAFQSLAAIDSQALIFLRLHFLEKVKKQRIAEAWDQHPATVGRRINSGLAHLREQLAQRLPDYTDTDTNSASSSQATEALILLCRDLLDTCVD